MNTTVSPVEIEHHRETLGIGESRPRLSWSVRTDAPSWVQAGYELEIDGTALGSVESDEQVLVPWPLQDLGSRERHCVRVRVWGNDGHATDWSEATEFETGLLEARLWSARLVSPRLPNSGDSEDYGDRRPAALLRGRTVLDENIVSARIRATAHGIMTLRLNGQPVGDDALHPGWTSYASRLQYRTWDVTHLVRPGANAVGVHLADGWYRGHLGFAGLRDVYGNTTAALVQLEVRYADGRLATFGTDHTWRSTPSAVTRADLYMGETLDTRLLHPGWAFPDFDDSDWDGVDVENLDLAILHAAVAPAVRVTESIAPVQVMTTPSGKTVLDFGQNLVGRLKVDLPAGHGRVTLRHAEVLESGELGTRPLRAARATDEVILNGEPLTWEPSFTFHGFRYAEITGWPGGVDPTAVRAEVIHTDMRRLGEFTCSDPLLSRLHANVVWSMRGNFVSVPTDCPQRDERLGWTGDLMAFAPTACYLYDTSGMLTGWLADLAADQRDDGNVPVYVPWADVDPDLPPLGAEAGWGDAATVVPWTLYQRYGDVGILRQQWASMTAWVDAFAARAGDGVDFGSGGFSFGDWLDAAAPDDQPWAARLPWQAVATAYLAHSAAIVRDAARILGHTEAVTKYGHLFDVAAARYRAEYVTPTGRAAFPSQTAYALGLRFGLLTSEQAAHAGELMAAQVAADEFRIGSGFLGTPHVLDALADAGEAATAWKLLLQRELPSWLYPVTMGATTIWERWDSMLPDGSINPGEMTSFNHYAFGAVADFLHRRVGGLAPAEPGYRRLRIAPLPTQELTWARTSHETPYGPAEVSWTLEGSDFSLTVTVPAGTRAEVHLPHGSADFEVGSGEHHFSCRFQPGTAASVAPAFTD